MAGQHTAAEVIRDGQGITIATVPCSELPFEIHGPHLVRTLGVERGRAWVRPLPSSPILVEQRVPIEDRIEGTPRRPGSGGVSPAEYVPELLRAPALLMARCDDERLQVGARPIGQ